VGCNWILREVPLADFAQVVNPILSYGVGNPCEITTQPAWPGDSVTTVKKMLCCCCAWGTVLSRGPTEQCSTQWAGMPGWYQQGCGVHSAAVWGSR